MESQTEASVKVATARREPPDAVAPKQPGRRWIQRLGAAGFLFFLIKGLLWLTVPALLAYLGYG